MTEATHTYTFGSPFGLIRLTTTGGVLVGLTWLVAGDHGQGADKTPPDGVTRQAAQEILDYAAGKRREFTVPVSLAGCSKSMRAWL